MVRIALRNLWDHKVRTALLGLAVVAGVGFVSASYVFTDSLSAAFGEAFTGADTGIDILVTPAIPDAMGSGGPGSAFPRLDAELVDVVAAVDGVQSATGSVQGFVTIVLPDEDRPAFGPPEFGLSWTGSGGFELQEGVEPTSAEHVLIDVSSAESRDVAVGDSIQIAGDSRAETFTVVGTFGLGAGGAGFGATFVAFTIEAASSLLGFEDHVNTIEVAVGEGTEVGAVVDAIAAVLPPEAEALDSRAAAEAQAAQLQEGIGFFNTFLLVFGAISLVVGAFVVYNAFRVVVAQRGRELALLRILGTTRRQLVWSVLAEATVVGVIASVIGVMVGVGLAVAIRMILGLVGIDLPDSGLVLSLRTAVVGLVVGVVTTLVAAVVPALRTTRISPMEALRDQPELGRSRPWWGAAGVVVLVGSLAMVGVGVNQAYGQAALTGDSGPLVLIGAGCVLAFAAVFLLARVLARPLIGVLGSGARSVAATLGRENARRTPRRTAVTASALMIGLGLVATVAVLSRSVEDTILGALEDAFTADFIVQSGGFDPTAGIPVEVASLVAELEEVTEVARSNLISVELPEGRSTLAVGVEPDTVELALSFEDVEGSFADLGPARLAIQRVEATARGWELGEEVALDFGDGPESHEVVAIFDFAGGASDSQSYYLEYGSVAARQSPPRDVGLYVRLAPGVDIEGGADSVADALSEFPSVQVKTISDIIGQVRGALTALLGMVAGLLLMSVVVAVVGIVLTLYLAVFERTRETGMLRAVGMTKRQVKQMIRFESVLIAVFGTALGVALGLFCGWALSVGVVGEGVRFGIPWMWIISGLVGALVAGVLAAVIPARRAVRMNTLEAIAYE
ncbi:ABC transporter permease [soil metagenome]